MKDVPVTLTYPVVEAMEVIFDNLDDPNCPPFRMFYDELNQPHRVKISKRTRQAYRLFIKYDYTCVACNRKATEFKLEGKHQNADCTGRVVIIGKKGRVVPLTIDHIIPVANGGPNDVSNYQCMCESCNANKGCSRNT